MKNLKEIRKDRVDQIRRTLARMAEIAKERRARGEFYAYEIAKGYDKERQEST